MGVGALWDGVDTDIGRHAYPEAESERLTMFGFGTIRGGIPEPSVLFQRWDERVVIFGILFLIFPNNAKQCHSFSSRKQNAF
jgi:hypothetical protein